MSFELLFRSVSLKGADVTDAVMGPGTPKTEAKSLLDEVGVDVTEGPGVVFEGLGVDALGCCFSLRSGCCSGNFLRLAGGVSLPPRQRNNCKNKIPENKNKVKETETSY